MSVWRRSQYHSKQHYSTTTTTRDDDTIGNKTRRHQRLSPVLFLVGILFAVGIPLQLFRASFSTDDVSGSYLYWMQSSSFVTPPIPRSNGVKDDDSSSSVASTVLTNESSWNEWEAKFYANNSILLDQLKISSVYRSTDPLGQTCEIDYARDYEQVTKPATNLLPYGNCHWPERMKQLKYPWHHAQFSTFHCPFVHFSPTQACQLLQSRTSYGNPDSLILLFVGDSLIRQILVGLGIVLTGNRQTGGWQYMNSTTGGMSSVWHKACSCENQYLCATLKQEEYGRFTHAFGHKDGAFRNLVDLCSDGTSQSYQVIFEQQNNSPMLSPMIKQAIKNHPYHQFVIVTDASAFHSGLNIRKTRRFLRKLETKLDYSNSTGLVIPMTVHHVGANKPQEYLETQGRGPVEDYNQQLRDMAMNRDYKLLDTYRLTQDMPSQDGTHYPMASVALAQILLHYIRDYIHPPQQ